ncbi:class I SAM-dependent methyltransferase [Aquimarina pacifica]|uniref:class I SAM-dependent methyltransferase n=1 Tax=Aquimarina pacifica TaxID=1296415 RepID=UPI0004BCB864|nr:class I SAM-dependent methyltransferase [Aquimarina pacifica]
MKKESTSKKNKKPWPTKAVMEQIYERKLWGGNDVDFYSGIGSHDPTIVKLYTDVVRSFLTSFRTPITVCDLGCGDFNIGKELVRYTEKYIAVDIVEDLIDRNKEKFKEENLEFHCLDIAVDDFPSGDCALLRQVLQHLSNTEVQKVIEKLSVFNYVILTEHVPEGDFIANKDIISGQGIRLKKRSGLDILAPPFNFRIKKQEQLASVVLDDNKGIIVTTLYEVL